MMLRPVLFQANLKTDFEAFRMNVGFREATQRTDEIKKALEPGMEVLEKYKNLTLQLTRRLNYGSSVHPEDRFVDVVRITPRDPENPRRQIPSIEVVRTPPKPKKYLGLVSAKPEETPKSFARRVIERAIEWAEYYGFQ